jgi:hypothetical protein
VQLLDRLRDGIDIAAVLCAGMVAGERVPIDRDVAVLTPLRRAERRLRDQHFIIGELNRLVARSAPHLDQHQRATAANNQPDNQQGRCPSARAPHHRNIPNSGRCSTAMRRNGKFPQHRVLA